MTIELRQLFIKYLTQDSKVKDMRRKDFNQAIFIDPAHNKFHGGYPAFNDVTLDMVMEKFDKSVKEWGKK